MTNMINFVVSESPKGFSVRSVHTMRSVRRFMVREAEQREVAKLRDTLDIGQMIREEDDPEDRTRLRRLRNVASRYQARIPKQECLMRTQAYAKELDRVMGICSMPPITDVSRVTKRIYNHNEG